MFVLVIKLKKTFCCINKIVCCHVDDPKGEAIISAKPQLRNTQAELTRLVPVTLRVKREQPKTNKQKVKTAIAEETFRTPSTTGASVSLGQVVHAPTKDDAYAQFMKEMEVLL